MPYAVSDFRGPRLRPILEEARSCTQGSSANAQLGQARKELRGRQRLGSLVWQIGPIRQSCLRTSATLSTMKQRGISIFHPLCVAVPQLWVIPMLFIRPLALHQVSTLRTSACDRELSVIVHCIACLSKCSWLEVLLHCGCFKIGCKTIQIVAFQTVEDVLLVP